MVNQYWLSWAKLILAALKLEPTPNRMQFLYAWMAGENTTAKNNPLATTWNMAAVDPGQSNFNYNGNYPVKNYSSKAIGLQATVNTLRQRNFAEIYRFLKNNISLGMATPLLVQQFTNWGTGYLPIKIWQSWGPDFKKKLFAGGVSLLAVAAIFGIYQLYKSQNA